VNEKPAIHSTWAATQLDEQPAVWDGTMKNRDAASETCDAASGTGNKDSETTDVGLASAHDSETGL
jgi:hypothetical protein